MSAESGRPPTGSARPRSHARLAPALPGASTAQKTDRTDRDTPGRSGRAACLLAPRSALSARPGDDPDAHPPTPPRRIAPGAVAEVVELGGGVISGLFNEP